MTRTRFTWVLLAGLASPACSDDRPGGVASESDGGSAETGGSTTADGSDTEPAQTRTSSGAGSDTGAGPQTSSSDATSGSAPPATSGSTGDSDADREPATLVLIDPGATNDAELVQTLAVGTSENNADRRVVLRLDPDEIPDLAVGDRLITPAEVQATTRCDVGQTAAGCDYNPKIRARLILTGNANDDDPNGDESKPLSEPDTLTCTKNEHHCMFVFRPAQATHVLQDGLALPCVLDDSCHVNLVMWAWHEDARPGGVDKVLVGGNEGNYLENGIVDPDKARLMVVRERNIADDDRHERETTGGGALSVPTNANATLVYSHELKGDGELKKGEQFVVEAKIVTTVSSRARFSTKMFLTKNPDATDGSGLDKTFPTQIGEHNGVNCTPDETCTTRKVAVFRVTDDINGEVYVNVMAKSAVPGGGNATVTVHRNDGWFRSTRYEPEHKG